jgi:hypothetical protein
MARLSPEKNPAVWWGKAPGDGAPTKGMKRRWNGKPKTWEIFPTMRIAVRASLRHDAPKGRISDISQVWHGLCRALGMKRDASAQNRNTAPRRSPMFTPDTSRNLFAAAISFGVSAVLFAYAIVPATPGLA